MTKKNTGMVLVKLLKTFKGIKVQYRYLDNKNLYNKIILTNCEENKDKQQTKRKDPSQLTRLSIAPLAIVLHILDMYLDPGFFLVQYSFWALVARKLNI